MIGRVEMPEQKISALTHPALMKYIALSQSQTYDRRISQWLSLVLDSCLEHQNGDTHLIDGSGDVLIAVEGLARYSKVWRIPMRIALI